MYSIVIFQLNSTLSKYFKNKRMPKQVSAHLYPNTSEAKTGDDCKLKSMLGYIANVMLVQAM
jgi:hypothetical protein